MTTDELNTIVAAVVAELEKSGVDFDYKAEQAEDDDLVFVIRGTAPNYQGMTVTWKGLLDIITAQATQAKNDAETAKNVANTILEQVTLKESNVSEMKTSVETTKSQVESMKNAVETTKGQVETMKTSIETTKEEVETMKTSVETSKSQVETMKTSIETTKGEVETLKSESETAKETATQKAAETTQAKGDVESMKASIEKTVADFNTLADQKKSEVESVYQTDLNELKGDLKSIAKGEELKSYLSFTMGQLHGGSIPLYNLEDGICTKSINTAYCKTGYFKKDEVIYFNDTEYMIMECEYDSSKNPVAQSAWATTSPYTIVGDLAVIEVKKVDSSTITDTSSLNDVAYTLKVIENNIVYKNDITYIDENLSELKNRIYNLDGESDWLVESNFKVGTLYAENGNLKESTNTSRISIKRDGIIPFLHEGDVVSLSDYVNYKFTYFTSDDKTTWTQLNLGWVQADIVIPKDAYYMFIINDNNSTVHTSVDTMFNLISYTDSTIYKYNIESRISKLEKIGTKYVHFSFDDCVFWSDLIDNESIYNSAFENSFLSDLKTIHEKYGTCFSLYCFNENDGKNISDVPSKFSSEFKKNVDWLRFGFHGFNSGTDYSIDQDTLSSDYETFVSAIYKMTGTTDAIARVTRLSSFQGTVNNVKAVRDAQCGVTGLLTSYDVRNNYYLDSDTNTFMQTHGKMFDSDMQIEFIKTTALIDYGGTVTDYMGVAYGNMNRYLEFFGHQYEWGVSGIKGRIESFSKYLSENRYSFGFPDDYLNL